MKNWVISNIVLLIAFYNVHFSYAAEYLYKDVPYLHNYLITSDFFGVIKKGLGNWIYDILSYLLDGCYDAYSTISNFDFFKNATIKSILNNLDTMVFSVFFIIFIIAIISKMLKIDNPLKILGNALICFLAVACFSTVLTLGVNMKDAAIKDIDEIVNAGDYQISSTIYASNTVDVLRSLKQGKVVNLSASQMEYFNSDEIIKKAVLIDKPKVDENTGEVTYEDLSDGILFTSFGEVRYFRYCTDFWSVNCTIIASIFVYMLAMLKHGFLLVDWFLINIFGKFALGRAFFGVDNLGKVGKSIAGNLIAQTVLYAMMTLFSVYMSSVMTSNIHWMFKVLLIFAFGMTVFVGSNFINKGLGVEDNFGKVASAVFASKMMMRSAKKGLRTVGNAVSSVSDGVGKTLGMATEKAYDGISKNYQDAVENATETQDFKDAVNEGRERDDIDNVKERMKERDYDDSIKEKAKQELYGKDYKVQEAKDRILQSSENKDLNEQAMKELYGEDYKVQQAKDKIVQADESGKVNEQAMKELYGDDYKVQQAKDKIIQADETGKINDQAMRELYGDDYQVKQAKEKMMNQDMELQIADQAKQELYGKDYQYQEVKDDVIKGEQRAAYVDQAKRELHGDDYKEKKMRSEIEENLARNEMKKQIIEQRSLDSYHDIGFKEYADSYEDVEKRTVDEDELSMLIDQLKKGDL